MIDPVRHDEMLRFTLLGGQARVLLCETTALCQEAADIHQTTPVCTAALGRLMTGTLMLGVMLKGQGESVSVTVKGGGPMGTLVAVADTDSVRACCDNPQVELPLRPDGKLDVGGAVGHEGRMSVVKDLGLREPYIGQSQLVSGELGIDFAQYFTVSEQQPSLVALGVLVQGSSVIRAGGLLIQPLPGCEEKTIEQIPLHQTKIWLRIDGDFQPREGRFPGGRDNANFYYSLDGSEWTQIGTANYPLRFDWQRFFMGTKFGIFNYATKRAGGYVDVNQFVYNRK